MQKLRIFKRYDEKESNCTDTLIAFDINIFSRYGKISEVIPMLQAAEALNQAGLSSFVKRMFYDSKSDCMSYELKTIEEVIGISAPFEDFESDIIDIFNKYIPQFVVTDGHIEGCE